MQRILAAVRPQARFLTVAMLGAWTALNLLLSAASPLTRGWPIQATTALTVPLMVLAMVYLSYRWRAVSLRPGSQHR